MVVGGVFLTTSKSANIRSECPFQLLPKKLSSFPQSQFFENLVLNKALNSLHFSFLNEHRETGLSALAEIKHVVILINGNLSLWERMSNRIKYVQLAEEKTAAKGNIYAFLKSISHIVVMLVSTLQPILDENVRLIDKQPQLIKLLQRITKISKILIACNEPELAMSELVVLESIKFLKEILTAKNCEQVEKFLQAYLLRVQHANSFNSSVAAKVQITSLDSIMKAWLHKYDIDLESSRILIVGPHGPRKGLIEKQYFETIYSQNGYQDVDDDKIYYVEVLLKHLAKIRVQDDLIGNFLSGCEANKKIGEKILKNKRGMFQDVLSQYGPKWLDELKNRDGPKPNCPFK